MIDTLYPLKKIANSFISNCYNYVVFDLDYDKLVLNSEKILDISKKNNLKFTLCLESIKDDLKKDAKFYLKSDPASKSLSEIYGAYPGFYAILVYRVSNWFYKNEMFLVSRLLSEVAHSKTGIDIHAGATISSPFMIDHGTGVVIGETSIIEKKVIIYQGVTLGALSVKKCDAKKNRHPKIEEGVVIYANATILGGNTTIGKKSVIGGNVWITSSVSPNSLVYNKQETKIKQNMSDKKYIFDFQI